MTVRFPRGLHVRTAAGVVQLFMRFQCRARLRTENRAANARSILSILLLAASFNTQLEIRAWGEDEESAVHAAEIFFQNDDEAALPETGIQPSPSDRTQEASWVHKPDPTQRSAPHTSDKPVILRKGGGHYLVVNEGQLG